jgi:quercetin dioxygenase-like cupin family protein
MESSRPREAPLQRLDEDLVHVFSADELSATLRGEPEYQNNRHTGITLMKTDELRVVLAAAEAGATLESHVVRGPATIFVLEGRLEIETLARAYRANRGDLVVLPRGETRRIVCSEKSTFLLALSPSASAAIPRRE